MTETIIDNLLQKIIEYIGPEDSLATTKAERKYFSNLIIDRFHLPAKDTCAKE